MSRMISTRPSTVATLLMVIQAATPGPKISYAWYWEMSTSQCSGLTARASISGVAQIDSICRPRSDCQVSGEISRVQPPKIRLIKARPKPTITKVMPACRRSAR